jgi:3-hydroxy-9,10-secoandrosta-1,3,5(10)-triene-9,17-dione monooxygenase reductase component
MSAALNIVPDPAPEYAPTPEFAEAMSALASGVVLVTCRVGDRPWGLTVTAFASVSAHPPTVLVSLASVTTSVPAIRASGRFGVSVLAEAQRAVARHGSAPGETKFVDDYTESNPTRSGSPVVVGALAHLDCELSDTVEVADHVVLFGRVRAAHAFHEGAPLVYHRRAYRSVAEPATGRNVRCLSS